MRRCALVLLAWGCGASPPPAPADDLGPRPTLAAPRAFTPPTPTVFALPDGPPVWHLPRTALPLVAVQIVVPSGAAADPAGQAGLAALTAEMMEQGAGPRGALTLSREADRLGATISVSAGRDHSVARLVVLKAQLEPALALLGDVVARPRFEAGEWARTQALWIAGLRSRAFEPGYVAAQIGRVALFGRDHPYGNPALGWLSTVEPLTLAQVKAFHARHWHPRRATVVVVGDVSADEVRALLPKALYWWAGAGEPAPVVTPSPPSPAAPRTVLVARPDSEQTVLLVLAPGPAASDPAQPALGLVNTPLGGGFTSRLNQNLREDKGYTYGASSRVPFDRGVGYLSAESAVHGKVTTEALRELLAELAKMQAGGPTEAELAKAKASARAADVETYEGIGDTADWLAQLAGLGLPPDFDARAALARDAVTLAAARAQAQAHGLAGGTIVGVGDAAVVTAAFAALGLPPPQERDVEGAVVEAPAVGVD